MGQWGWVYRSIGSPPNVARRSRRAAPGTVRPILQTTHLAMANTWHVILPGCAPRKPDL